ncbi:YraN family protein [Agrobacterium vitis]|uniref:YraN family protein n=1 Tax=Agrobacterium vitis TaxID=373 RepID=UPI0013803549|nr:YraN family protein [Agrobacterium vitis]
MRADEKKPREKSGAARKRAERRGRWSEYLAAAYLLSKGYRIVALRYKTRSGEIDLIVRRGDLVVLVEVKARATQQSAVDAVSFESQRRIRAAGDLWLCRQPDASRLSIRCDIVAVLPWRWPTHFPGAF